MKRVYIKKSKINEDGANNTQQSQQSQQNNTEQQTNNSGQTSTNSQNNSTEAHNAYMSIVSKYNILKNQFNDQKKVISKQLEVLNNRYGTSYVLESKNSNLVSTIRFSKKLFETYTRESRREKIKELIYSAIDAVRPRPSYTPSMKELGSYAKNINMFINKSKWNEEIIPKNHWEELEEEMKKEFKRSNKFDYSDLELNRIMEMIKDRFYRSESLSWIFGNEITK